MTSTSRPQLSYREQTLPDKGARQLCFIVGLACLAGFGVDVLEIALPPSPLAMEWRASFLQQVGDRGILLLFGSALLIYSQMNKQRFSKVLSLFCLSAGIAFILSCILLINDSQQLKMQAVANITTQAEQLRADIEERQSSSGTEKISPELLSQANLQIDSQAKQLKQRTQADITRAGLSSLGNLIVIGLGLLGVGRFGLSKSKNTQYQRRAAN